MNTNRSKSKSKVPEQVLGQHQQVPHLDVEPNMKSSLNLTPTSPRTSSESRPSSEVPDLSLNLVHTHHLEPWSVTVPIVWSGEVHLTTRWFVPLVLVQSWSSPEFNCLNLQLQMNSLPLQRPILQCAANKQTTNNNNNNRNFLHVGTNPHARRLKG